MLARTLNWSVTLVALAVVLSPLAPSLLGHHVGSASSGPGTIAGNARASTSSPSSKAVPSPSVRAATESRILSSLQTHHVPMKYAYLPNFNAEVSTHGGVVTPTYSHSPAPYGIASYGVSNTTGNASPYILNSPSFEGAITFNSLNEFYLDDDSTDYIGAQLNTVVSNVTLFGTTNYSFWNQNVITYSARSNLLQFIDNIWNFSSPAFYMSPNVFNQTGPNGTLVAPSFYYALGPVINITMPFTLHLYINATTTNVNGFPDDIVYFNYTVIKSGATIAAGTFDWAIFNSQNPAAPTSSIPAPEYQLNGFYPSPTGYLPYESELVFCGPGGGSTTTVLDINATMNLWYLNTTSSSYQTVPSAFAYGTNTGETIEGATEWFDASHTVHVGPGPTLPFPLWNASPTAAPGFMPVTGSVFPDTAFVFLNQTTTGALGWNYSWAAWAPIVSAVGIHYDMPVGDYTGTIMDSNYDQYPLSIVGATSSTWNLGAIFLTANASKGLYTPLIAMSNTQLAELAVSGAGSPSNPYVLPNDAAPSLDPIFGSINDFAFPVFPGLLLVQTNAYVLLNDSSTFHIDYGGRVLHYMQANGLPTSNNLQIELYGTSHVSLVRTSGISGWFDGANLNGFPLASVMVWNCSSTLIADNVFSSQGTSVLLYGGTGNTITGNWFNMDPILATAEGPALLAGTYAFGPQVYESGDLLFNNAFLTQIPAYSPAGTIYYETFYSSFNSSWVNAWNVSAQPASTAFVFNGITVNGSIVSGSYVGGNLWWNYAAGGSSLPFGGNGLVAVGGDWLPIVGDLATFTETGLPPGTLWSFVFDGISVVSASPTVTMSFFDGTFAYSVAPIAGYTMTGGTGSLVLFGGPGAVAVAFAAIPPSYVLSFVESGLPATTSWTVWVNGVSQTLPSGTIAFNETNGTYTWSVVPVAGLLLEPSSGSVSISGADRSVGISFVAPAAEEFTVAIVETGLAAGTGWSATLAGVTVSSNLDLISFSEPNGSYPYSVTNVTGYSATGRTGTATVSGGPTNLATTFAALPVTLSGTYTPTAAQVWVDNAVVTVTAPGTFSVQVMPGSHSVQLVENGYVPYYNNVSIGVGGSGSVTVVLVPSASGTTTESGLTGSNLALLAGIAVLALIFLIGMVYFWSRSRRPPMVMRPEGSPSPSNASAPKP